MENGAHSDPMIIRGYETRCDFYIMLHLILGLVYFGLWVDAWVERLKGSVQASPIAERQTRRRCDAVCCSRRSMAYQVGLQAIESHAQIRGNMCCGEALSDIGETFTSVDRFHLRQ